MPNKRWRFAATLMMTSGMLVLTLAACGRPDTTGFAPTTNQLLVTDVPAATVAPKPATKPRVRPRSATATPIEPTTAPTVEGQPTSGIAGQATQGPMCGGPARNDKPCPDAPIEAIISIEDAATGKAVAEFTTGVDGTFRQALVPGTYLLVARSKQGGPFPAAQPLEVTVEQDQLVDVIIRFDTGKR